MRTLLARALDALHSRVEAIKDWLDGWHPVFAGDEFDSADLYEPDELEGDYRIYEDYEPLEDNDA